MTTAAKILSKAASQIGYKESPRNSNRTKYNRWFYGKDTKAPWCAIFVCWVFDQCGAKKSMPGGKYTASCPIMGDYVIASGRKVSKSAGKPGDIVLYDFDGNRSSDHVGIIEKKNQDGSYTCIEGNTAVGNDGNGGMVMRRKRYQYQIYHIYRPPYTASTAGKNDEKAETARDRLAVDGDWGVNTTRSSQELLGTVEDGIVSSQPRACRKYIMNGLTSSWKFVSLSKGSPMIRALQKMVKADRDGKCGKETVKALQRFLAARGLYNGKIDGYMGKATVKGWQRYINGRL